MISNFPAMLRVWTALLELLVCQFIITAVDALINLRDPLGVDVGAYAGVDFTEGMRERQANIVKARNGNA